MKTSEPERLARAAAEAALRCDAARTLLLDVDGTLAPIVPRPPDARIPPPTLVAMRTLLDRGWRVVLVSGRPAEEVRSMAPIPGVIVFGTHGFEASPPWKPVRDLGPDEVRRLERIERGARALAEGVEGAAVERKPAGLAFHDRNVAPGTLALWRDRLRGWLDAQDLGGFETLPGRRVVEIRPRGVHKGAAVRQFLPGSAGRDDSLVAIGDDRTDEDMFREIGDRGMTIRVGRASARTAAAERLASPAAVSRFLRSLAAG